MCVCVGFAMVLPLIEDELTIPPALYLVQHLLYIFVTSSDPAWETPDLRLHLNSEPHSRERMNGELNKPK